MSSAIYLKFPKAIPLADWEAFCKTLDIEHSSNTVGGNVFYFRGPFGIEIRFGEVDYRHRDLPFTPPADALKITVSTFFMGDLKGVAQVAKWILQRWYGSFEADEELRRLMPSEEAKK